jgi:predicted dehydrogenase
MLLSVIGTSQIIEEHLQSAVKNGFKLHSISTTKNIESINLKKIYKKYSFKKKYSNWKQMYLDTKNYKNMTYLVCPRIKDTLSISNFFLHNKKIIFVEKPLSTNKKSYSELEKYKKQIFVGYNRVYYENLKYLKSQKFSNSLVNVNCVEKNNKSFIENSCHIVSIINFLFDDLKIIYRFKNKNHIFCRLYSKKKKIFVNFLVTFNVPKNFSI